MPIYTIPNGDRYEFNSRADAQDFEKDYPDAKIELTNGDAHYNVPLQHVDGFFKKYPDGDYWSTTRANQLDTQPQQQEQEPQQPGFFDSVKGFFNNLTKENQYSKATMSGTPSQVQPATTEQQSVTEPTLQERQQQLNEAKERGNIVTTTDKQDFSDHAFNIAQMGKQQEQPRFDYRQADNKFVSPATKQNTMPTVADIDKFAEEESKIQFTPKKVESDKDILDNAMGRFSLTEEGQALQAEADEASRQHLLQLTEEFSNTPEYKEITAVKPKNEQEQKEMEEKLNAAFDKLYGDEYSSFIAPYQQRINDALFNRYGASIADEQQKLQKAQIGDKVSSLTSEINDAMDEHRKKNRVNAGSGGNAMNALMASKQNVERNDPDMLKLRAADHLMEQTNEILDAVKNGDEGIISQFGRGFWDNLDARNFSFGVSDMVDNATLLSTLRKAEKGEKLSDAEEKLLEAQVTNMAVMGFYGSDLSRAYKAGQTTGVSLPYMLEFIANPISGSGNAIAKSLLNWGAKKFGAKIAERSVSKLAAGLFGQAAAAAGMVETSSAPRVASGAMERLAGNYEINLNDKGKPQVFKTGNMSDWEAVSRESRVVYAEDLSEMIFNAFKGFNPFEKVAMPEQVKNFMDMISKNGVAKFVNKISNSKTYRQIADRAQFHGWVEEPAEEVLDNLAEVAMGEMTLEQATSLDTNLDIIMGLAPTSLAFSMIGLGSLAHEKRQNRKKMESAFGKLNNEQKNRLAELQEMAADENNDFNATVKNFMEYTINDKSLTQEERRAELEYLYESVKANEIDKIDAERTPEQKVQDGVEEAEMVGAEAVDPADMNRIGVDLEVATQEMNNTFGETTRTMFDADPMAAAADVMNNPNYTAEEKQVAIDYLNAKTAYNSMIGRIREDIGREVEESNAEIDSRTDADTGAVRPATLKNGNRQVYIMNGNVVMYEDGSGVDIGNSSKDVIVKDAETGKLEFIPASDIAGIEQPIPAEQLKEETAANIQQTKAQEEADKINGTLAFQQGDTYQAMGEDGTQVELTIISDNGDGSVNVGINGEAAAVPMAKETVQQMADRFKQQQAQKASIERRAATAVEEQAAEPVLDEAVEQAPVQEEVAPVAEETATEAAPETVEEQEEPMPMMGEGENIQPDYGAATPQRTSRYIYDENGLDEKDADQLVQMKRKAAEKVLSDTKKAKPEFGDKGIGDNIVKLKQARAAWEQSVADAQRQVDYWNAVEQEHAMAVRQREEAAKAAPVSEETAVSEANNDDNNLQIEDNSVSLQQEKQIKDERTDQSDEGLPAEGHSWGTGNDEASNLLRRSSTETNQSQQTEGSKGRLLDVLSKSARNDKTWLDKSLISELRQTGSGAENEVYLSDDGKYVLKVNAFKFLPSNSTDFSAFVNRIDTHNELFPDVPYRIEGFTENSKGEISVVLSQPYITPLRDATGEEIDEHLENMGFYTDMSGDWTNGDVIIRDAKSANVLVGEDGLLHFVDTVPHDTTKAGEMLIIPNNKENQQENEYLRQIPDEKQPLRDKAKEWEKKVGVKVTLVESVDELPANSLAAKAIKAGKNVQGWYNITRDSVYIYVPNVESESEIDKTYMHEVVAHKGLRQLLGTDAFNKLCDDVFASMSEADKEYYMNYPGAERYEGKERERFAADEYIAFLSEYTDLNPTLWEKIVAAVREALRQLGVDVEMTDDDIAYILNRSYDNLVEANADLLRDKGAEVDTERGDVRFAVKDILKGKELDNTVKELMAVTGRSESTVKKWIKAEESLAKVILDDDNVKFLDMQVDESVPSIWNNSDYPQGTVEFSNICRKRLPFTMIYQRLQKEFPNMVFDASTLEDIRNTMKQNGADVACGLCYVEDRRQLLGEIGQGFIDALTGKNTQLNENQSKALSKIDDSYVPNLYDLLTLDGMKKLRREHPSVAQAFVEYNNARGMQAGRLFQAYSAYHREILSYPPSKVKSINDNGGLRIFSFSDFEAHHLIDLVQVLTDAASKGIKVQGYTKVPEFAKAVKDTKMKLNRSLIAKDKGYVDADYQPKEGEAVSPNVIDGKRLLLDTVEGINVNHPEFFDSTSNPNVGNILVGINDEQIKLAMRDPFVDYIIPFHSGLSENIRQKKGIGEWVNYKLKQLEKKQNEDGKLTNADKHGINIYTDVLPRGNELIGHEIKNARDFQKAFFAACAEKGWIPRFWEFIDKDKNGNYKYTPGYEKMLIDFKLFDKNGKIVPQEAVVPVFDNDFNKQILDDYVKGEKEKMPNDELYEKVRESLGLAEGEETRFRITPEEDAEYMDAVNSGDKKAVEKMVKDAVKRAMPNTKATDRWGNPRLIYHGTPSRNQFYVFNGDIYLASNREVANQYTHGRGILRSNPVQTGRVMPAYVNLENPLEVDANRRQFDNIRVDWSTEPMTVEQIAAYAKENGYDGAIIKRVKDNMYKDDTAVTDVYVAFSPEQVKSAGPTYEWNKRWHYPWDEYEELKNEIGATYDDNGNVIPLSQRFNPENNDIRFRVDEKETAMRDALADKLNEVGIETSVAPVYYSNAEKAVQDIKQEKATPEQWLKMIEKNGGLKQGEDKWTGLSDYLKNSKAKSLTKQEVLDYIRKNAITIYDEDYVDDVKDAMLSNVRQAYGDEMADWFDKVFDIDFDGEAYIANEVVAANMYEKYTGNHIELDEYDGLYSDDEDAIKEWAADYIKNAEENIGVKSIDEVRRNYTTYGLKNKREIALVVPSIEAWNESDQIHFGDAGNGRAVAWVRFGDTETNQNSEYASTHIYDELEKKYGSKLELKLDEMPDEDVALKEFADHIYRGEDADIDDEEGYMAIRLGDERAKRVIPIFEKLVSDNAKNKVERVLVIDEIQSKRHQEGREKGYANTEYNRRVNELGRALSWGFAISEEEEKEIEELMQRPFKEGEEHIIPVGLDIKEDDNQFYTEFAGRTYSVSKDLVENMSRMDAAKYLTAQAREDVNAHNEKVRKGIPDAPFEKNWHELAMKRMLRYAAENGYDKIAWTKGNQQAERYDIGGVVKSVEAPTEWKKDSEGTSGAVRIIFKDGNRHKFMVDKETGNITYFPSNTDAEGKHITEVLGKDLGEKVLNAEEGQTFSGEDLRIGGEGMRGFYDEMLPRFMNKYGKKWGVKVGEVDLPNLEQAGQKMWSVDVTPEMKESVMQGQPMFHRTSDGQAYGYTQDGKIYIDPRIATSETPIHEYAHLWAEALRRGNAEEWSNVVNLMKGTSVWNEVAENYPELSTDDLLAEEVLAHYSGSRGAARLRKAQEDAMNNANGVFEKAEVASMFDSVRRALNRFWKAVADFLNIHYTSAEEVADRVLNDLLSGVNPTEMEANGEVNEESNVRFRVVDDKETLDKLNNSPTVKRYRAMAEIDGKLYPPMSAYDDGKLREPTELNTWEQAEETPFEFTDEQKAAMDALDKREGKGYVTLIPKKLRYYKSGNTPYDPETGKGSKGTLQFLLTKDNGDTVWAAYNPYFHTSTSGMNDQFTSAYKRPNLVVAEVEIPQEETGNAYKAENAKNSTGDTPWHSGTVNGALPKDRQRTVTLSRYAKVNRVVPDAEVADMIAKQLEGTDIEVPFNVVTPSLREELVKKGVKIGEPEKGNAGDASRAEYERWNANQVRFRVVDEEFNKKLDSLTEDNQDKVVLSLGSPSKILLDAGVEDKPMKLYGNKIISKQKKHGFELEDLHNLPSAIADPIAVFNNYKADGNRAILTELKTDSGNFLVAVTIGKGEDVDVNIVSTLFNKSDSNLLDWLRNGKATYINNKKTQEFLHHSALYAEALKNHESLYDANKDVFNELNKFFGEKLYVRTKNFKKWFGDWEKDPENASKVVDENGEPKVVYHSTDSYFSVFDKEKLGLNTDENADSVAASVTARLGFWASDAKEAWRENAMPIFLDIKNPIVYTSLSDLMESIETFIAENGLEDAGVEDIAEQYTDYYLKGSDGIIVQQDYEHNGASSYVAYKSNQIKSAIENNGEYSNENDDIRFSISDDVANEINGKEYNAGVKTFDEAITEGLAELVRRNKDAVQTRADVLQRVNNQLRDLIDRLTSKESAEKDTPTPRLQVPGSVRSAAAAQRAFDKSTVDEIVRLTRMLLSKGFIGELPAYEVKRLMGYVNNAVGRKDIVKQAKLVVDLLLKRQLDDAAKALEKQLSVRGSKVGSKGVEVQGRLDVAGQKALKAFKEYYDKDAETIQRRIEDCMNRMSEEGPTGADAAAEYQGLMMAKRYNEDIKQSELEEFNLKKEIEDENRKMKEGAPDAMSKEEYDEWHEATWEAIRKNRMDRLDAYVGMLRDFGGALRLSVESAKAFREAEQSRVRKIYHYANSDLEGVPSDEHSKPTFLQGVSNMSLVRFFLSPMISFDSMLRFFGRKSPDGRGYLWNHFMSEWVKRNDEEWKNLKKGHDQLDAKVREIFGDGVKRWSDLFTMERGMQKLPVEFWDGGKMKPHDLTQGNMLYIYMVNKMEDGKMKLRRMGITEEDVDRITEIIDPRFIQLADWIQDVFLKEKRIRYNEIHEKLFGAPMASIDNYFPLVINKRSRGAEVDIAEKENDKKPATITANIIKRVKNSTALDITNVDAFDLVLAHLQQMEHWAAFAELNRDMNTLLSYRTFRNKVQNMVSAQYGGGKKLLDNFNDACAIAGGAYTPKIGQDSLDKHIVNIAKGVTAAKIAFRLFTAIKQLLSYPAYFSEASVAELAKSTLNPKGIAESWNWAIEKLPGFAERWQSRKAGDNRLDDTELDYSFWKNKIVETASRWGMSPNAFVDGLTVTMGAKAIYETKKKQYIKDGYDEARAEELALRDASVAYNETQQSSGKAYMSPVQLDRTALSVALTVFRNSSMGYQRRLLNSLRNLSRMANPNWAAESEEFTEKQLRRDGLFDAVKERLINEGMDEEKATAEANMAVHEAAERVYNRALTRSAVDVVIFGFIMQFAWNLGSYMPYLIGGDDDDKKKEMLEDAAMHALAGGVEGMAGGSVISEIYNKVRNGDNMSGYNINPLPLMSDIQNTLTKVQSDRLYTINNAVNILMQSLVGVNPETITDIVLAFDDAAGGNLDGLHEFAFLMMRLANFPQSQLDELYIDELDLKGKDAVQKNPVELAKRYAEYKAKRNAPLLYWMYSDAEKDKLQQKFIKRFEEKKKERVLIGGDPEVMSVIDGYKESDAYTKTQEALDSIAAMPKDERKEQRDSLYETEEGAMHRAVTKAETKINSFAKKGNTKAVEYLRSEMARMIEGKISVEDFEEELKGFSE